MMRSQLVLGGVSRILLGVCATCVSAAALAQSSTSSFSSTPERAETWEVTLHPNFFETQTVKGSGGSSAKIDSTVGWGIFWGYNFNNYLNLGMDSSWSQPNVSTTITSATAPARSRTVNGDFSAFTLALDGTFYLMPGSFAPFVSAGVGWTAVNTRIASAPPVPGCWWDPWWGYVCDYYYPTYAVDKISYNSGVGLRWDIGEVFFLKGSWNRQWIDVGTVKPTFDAWKLDLGWKF